MRIFEGTSGIGLSASTGVETPIVRARRSEAPTFTPRANRKGVGSKRELV
jgi:hypothetical protein